MRTAVLPGVGPARAMAHAQEGADEAGGCGSLPTIDARKSPSGRHCRGCRSKSLSARSTIFLYQDWGGAPAALARNSVAHAPQQHGGRCSLGAQRLELRPARRKWSAAWLAACSEFFEVGVAGVLDGVRVGSTQVRAHHASCSWARSRRALSLPGRARNHVRYSGVVNTFHMMFEHIWRGCPAAVDVRASPKWLAASLRPQGQQLSSAIRAAKRTDQAPPSSGMRGLTNAKVRALELLGRGMDCYRCVTINPSEIGVSQGQRVEQHDPAAPEAQHPTIQGTESPLDS